MSNRDDDDLPLSKVPPVHEDVRREVEFHLEQRAAELVARGMSPDAAQRAAREAFGDREGVEEACRAIESRRRATRRRARRIDEVRADLSLGLRMLRKSPAFTAAAVVTLALGIGATSAIFSIVNQVLLRPLAFEDSDRLVRINERHENGWGNVSWANLLDPQREARSFAVLASYGDGPTTVLGTETPLRVRAAAMSRDYFKVFPTRPVLGRLPRPDEHRFGAPPVAVVSHAFWRDHLGAPATLEGVRLRMRLEHEVVGVLPPDFDFPTGAQLWLPLELYEQSMSRTSHNYEVVGRLAPAIDPAAAEREGTTLMTRMAAAYAPDFDATGLIVTPLQESLTASARTPLLLLLGASVFVLLAACTNLASAMLARGTARQAEIAMRTALGATRGRIVRQLLTESAVLSMLGLAVGLALAWALLRLHGTFAPEALRQWEVRLDGRVLAFSALCALLTTLLFGLLPALRLSTSSPSGMLRGGMRASANPGRALVWRALVAVEVAFAAALLAGSALLIRSFGNVLESRLGFDPVPATIANVNLPSINYGDSSGTVDAFHARVLAHLRASPEVQAAGFINVAPLRGDGISGAVMVESKPPGPRGDFNAYAVYRVVGGDYFAAAGIPVLRGRSFGPGDDRRGPPVVVVSAELARREWPGEDPIGKRLRPAGMDGRDEPWWSVVGVVDDVRTRSRTAPFSEVYYFDGRQRPQHRSRSVTYVVRAAREGVALDPLIRRSVAGADPQVPVEIRPMASLVSGAVADRAFTVFVLGAFAGIALLLAVVGIYAVVSYSVEQRRREIGVRVALGATPATIWRLIVGGAATAVAPGLVLGAVLAFADARALGALVYGITPLDPVALGGAFLLLALAALASALGPAARATRVSPMRAIQTD